MSFDNLFNQIKNGKYKKITDSLHETLEYEGWTEEINIYDKECFEFIKLNISPKDVSGLKKFDNSTITKFNEFDIKLKDTFGISKYIDLIDYDKGEVKVVRVKKECLPK